MAYPELLAEQAEWRREDIRYATLQIVGYYAHTLQTFGAYWWLRYAQRISQAVRAESVPRECTLKADYFELIFYPPRPSLTPHIKESLVVWEEAEPRLVFHDMTYLNLLPSERNYIYRTNEAIAEEVMDVYKLRIEDNPFSFVFPKNEYANLTIMGKPTLIGGFPEERALS